MDVESLPTDPCLAASPRPHGPDPETLCMLHPSRSADPPRIAMAAADPRFAIYQNIEPSIFHINFKTFQRDTSSKSLVILNVI